jgi:hypothetical protein
MRASFDIFEKYNIFWGTLKARGELPQIKENKIGA